MATWGCGEGNGPGDAVAAPAAAALVASLYASAVLRGRRRRPAGRIMNHTEEKKEKLRVLSVSVVETLWLRPAQRSIAPDQVSVITKLSASVVQEHEPPESLNQ